MGVVDERHCYRKIAAADGCGPGSVQEDLDASDFDRPEDHDCKRAHDFVAE